MSLLLDALRRAGAAREGSVAEKLAPGDGARGASAGQRSEAGAVAGRARAEAVFRGGSAGHPRLRTGVLIVVILLLLVALALVGAWYYRASATERVDRSLARYTPEPEAASGQRPVAASGTLMATDTAAPDAASPPMDAAIDASPGTRQPTDNDGVDEGAVEPAAASETTPKASPASTSGEPAATQNAGDAGAGTAAAAGGNGDTLGSARSTVSAVSTRGSSASGDSKPGTPKSGNPKSGNPKSGNPKSGNPKSGTSVAGTSGADTPRSDTPRSNVSRSQPVVHHSQSPSELGTALHSGYKALRTGDLATARADYAHALEIAPSNRDALLGAAAVAARQGRRAAAMAHYRRVLADHPRDSYARAGLAGLQQPGEASRSASDLKTRLRQSPDAHALRFALGNVYAQQQRWAEAQQAYFEAFRDAPGEADYAFNLAVALDHLDQRKQAREYYRRALALADNGAASFSQDVARRRLELLDR